jgi:uncharacterized protein (TIGR00369 family)
VVGEDVNWSLAKLNKNRLYQALGIALTELDTDRCHSIMIPTAQACWPEENQPHGGIIFTQMDTTMATAVLSTLSPGMGNCSTIDLSIQYLAPAGSGQLACETRVERRGKRVCFVRGEIRRDDGEIVAMGQGTFRVFHNR